MTTYGHYINGTFTAPQGTLFTSKNPAYRPQELGTFGHATPEEVDAAIKAAKAAQHSWWRDFSEPQRANIITRFSQLIGYEKGWTPAQTADDTSLTGIANIVTKECGKVLTEGRADVIEARHMCECIASHGRQEKGQELPSEIPGKRMYRMQVPKGVIACITPWNFPFAIPMWQIMPSLLRGNTVVLKPSEETPLCGYKVAEIAHQAGFPPGVLNVIHGDGRTGNAMVAHPDIDAIIFTGSYGVARMIREKILDQPYKTLATETGGKNSMLIFNDADPQSAAEAVGISMLRTTGQRCVTASRVLVERGIYDRFVPLLRDFVASKKTGDSFVHNSVYYGPVINQKGLDKILFYNDLSKKEGANILLEGKQLTGGDYDHGFFITPHLYEMPAEAQKTSRCLNEEVFGPHLAILPFDGLEDGIALANNTPFGLAMAAWTDNRVYIKEMKERLRAGMVYFNLPSIGAEVQGPFGGMKMSGHGHPSGEDTLDFVVHKVARTENFGKGIVMAQGLSTK